MFDGKVVLVPHLLRFLGAADMLVIHVGGQGVGLHLHLVQHVVNPNFHLAHSRSPPGMAEGCPPDGGRYGASSDTGSL